MQKNNLLIKQLICFSLFFLPTLIMADDHERERRERREHHDTEEQIHEEIEEAFSELSELVNNDTGTIKALSEIRKAHENQEPEEYLEHLIHLIELYEEAGPHIFRLELHIMVSELHVHKLVDHFHLIDNEKEREVLKGKIKTGLAELLKIRLEQREREFKHLSKELEHIKKGIDAVKKNPDHFINKKMNELIGGDFDPFE